MDVLCQTLAVSFVVALVTMIMGLNFAYANNYQNSISTVLSMIVVIITYAHC